MFIDAQSRSGMISEHSDFKMKLISNDFSSDSESIGDVKLKTSSKPVKAVCILITESLAGT